MTYEYPAEVVMQRARETRAMIEENERLRAELAAMTALAERRGDLLKTAYSDLLGMEGYFTRLGSMGTVASLKATLDAIEAALSEPPDGEPDP